MNSFDRDGLHELSVAKVTKHAIGLAGRSDGRIFFKLNKLIARKTFDFFLLDLLEL